jgi:hypothetical protein
MSNQINHSSRLSKILWDHLRVLTTETLAKLFVALFFENGFDFEHCAIVRNCIEVENTWFGLKNHITSPSIDESGVNVWFDKKCQIDFLIIQLKRLSETLPSGFNSNNLEHLRGCLLLLKMVLEKVNK